MALDDVAPDMISVTDTNVPHVENISYFGDGYAEAQMVYNFTLLLALYSFQTGDATHLCNWARTLRTPSPQTTFFNFMASHDGVGLRPLEGILSTPQCSRWPIVCWRMAVASTIARRRTALRSRMN